MAPVHKTTIEEDDMSEFNLNCERFLAATRQHFFARDLGSASAQDNPEDDSSDACGETAHRPHANT
jgi:hypothetical protein